MKKAFAVFSFALLPLLGACNKDPGYHVAEYKEYKFDEVPADVHLPSAAWDLLEFKTPEVGGEKSAEKKEEPKEAEKKEGAAVGKDLVFAEVTVYLVEKNDDVVKDKAIKIELPRGGGEVDLSQYLTGNNGSFYVGFEFPDFKDSTAQKVLFLSNARKRRIDDQVFGAGCNQFVDITTQFMKSMQGQGLKVNTTRDRHLSVLGGTFLFAAQKAGEIEVSQVTFKDSKHSNLFCEAH